MNFKDDSSQFVALAMGLPWLAMGFFVIELHEAGYLRIAAFITAVVSVGLGLLAARTYPGSPFYKRKGKQMTAAESGKGGLRG